MRPQDKTMRLKIRNLVQQAALACVGLTVCVLVLQNLAHSLRDSTAAEERPRSPKFLPVQAWPERAPRSLGRDYEVAAAAGDSNTVLREGEPSGGRREEDLENEEEAKQRRLLNTLVATATAQPSTSLDDLFITVKTTRGFHHTRLDLILKTWFTLARQQVGPATRIL
ncbi:Fringe glycosyltransferase [Portunus trituberculatus]|uniref:Fringe glycosyltransferase n=1 Tax=Portunus trituberculatus TaxID=210409 RepID=A0A5B7DQH8_PORTR|nr:Fringe glycosyltransferase [Portunus trituberculatus]